MCAWRGGLESMWAVGCGGCAEGARNLRDPTSRCRMERRCGSSLVIRSWRGSAVGDGTLSSAP